MSKNLSFYRGLASEMIQEDQERDKMHEAMEEMYHLEWDLPGAIKNLQWMRKFISTDPFDALRAMTRLLSTVTPKIKVQPLAPNVETKTTANTIERALTWHLSSAGRRGRAKVISDLALSAGRHDEICAQVVCLDVQASAAGMDPKRLRAARRFGPFAVLVRNPRHVHSRYSDWMLEATLYRRVCKAQEVVDFWGDRAHELTEMIGGNPQLQYATIYDMWDLDQHTVWCYPSDVQATMDEGAAGGNPIVLMAPEDHQLDFIPWVVRVGGTNLDDKPEHQRYPLLYSVYRAGQWVSQNILDSLTFSEAIAHAASPRGVTYSADPNNPPEVDYGDPTQNINLMYGAEEYKPIPTPEMDRGLLEIADRLAGAIQKSSIPAVLQTGDFPSGTAFATLNLATQSAVKAISPHKTLAENSIADICTQILQWVDYTGKPLIAYGVGAEDQGAQYIVTPEDFDVDNLYIEVELTADVPTDRQGRINAAAIAVERLGMSRERGLEEAGVQDPQAEMKQSMYEQVLQNELQIALQSAQARAQLQIQMMSQQAMQMQQQQMQQQMMEQQAAAQGGMGGMMGGQMPMEQPMPGIPGVEGLGYDPSMGGQPPAMANPYATREMQSGLALGGVPMAEEGQI